VHCVELPVSHRFFTGIRHLRSFKQHKWYAKLTVCEDDESLYEILVIFGLNKAKKSIKYKHERLDWEGHAHRLQYIKTFASRYHVTLPTFNMLVELLRPSITVNERKSRNSTGNNEPIYPEMVVGAGLRFLGGSSHKDIEDIYWISNHSSRRIIGMFVNATRSCEGLSLQLLVHKTNWMQWQMAFQVLIGPCTSLRLLVVLTVGSHASTNQKRA
jgi:hypothetical protein